jgi:hypothetical protein
LRDIGQETLGRNCEAYVSEDQGWLKRFAATEEDVGGVMVDQEEQATAQYIGTPNISSGKSLRNPESNYNGVVFLNLPM